jgi:rhodanese-related sulfurtransferase
MKDIINTRRLSFAIAILVFIILVGFITFKPAKFNYRLTAYEMLNELSNQEIFIDVVSVLDQTSSSSSFVLIDVRTPDHYSAGKLGNAINIPISEILTDESILFFEKMKKESSLVVLYGKNQLEINGTWMLLRQIGFNNVKILTSGYDCLIKNPSLSKDKLSSSGYDIEKPSIDFSQTIRQGKMKDNKVPVNTEPKMQIVPVKREKKTGTAGGC